MWHVPAAIVVRMRRDCVHAFIFSFANAETILFSVIMPLTRVFTYILTMTYLLELYEGFICAETEWADNRMGLKGR